MNSVDFSVIIPQRNSLDSLTRLFDSIPFSDKIEVILGGTCKNLCLAKYL